MGDAKIIHVWMDNAKDNAVVTRAVTGSAKVLRVEIVNVKDNVLVPRVVIVILAAKDSAAHRLHKHG
jgi:hypothetical protein